MFFLRYSIVPTESHPGFAVLGEGLVNCWINRPTLTTADRAARADIKRSGWEVLERETAEEVTEDDYDDEDGWREYYRQALTDREVFVYHTSPRYPVYWVVVAVSRGEPPEDAEAHYFLCGEQLLGEGERTDSPDFWDDFKRQTAQDAASAAIAEAGWTVTRIVSHRPCGSRDVPEELRFYYEEAEDSGACIVFVHDGEDAQGGESG
jgi:hypothetical protein